MVKQRKKILYVDFTNIETSKHLSPFEVSVRTMLMSGREWETLFFWMDMDEALSRLTERQRLCFSLKHIDGYTETEIAEMLGISQPVVSQHRWAAIQKLSKILEDGYKNP